MLFRLPAATNTSECLRPMQQSYAMEKTSEGVSSQKKERLCAQHQEKGINTQEPENKETFNGPSSLQDSFHSHFSFIQLSLNSASEAAAGESGSRESKEFVGLGGIEKAENINFHLSGEVQRISRTELWASCNSLCDEVGTCPLEAAEDGILQVCTNNAFSSSTDSLEATSADSSVTSGYESCGIASDHSWDFLMKEYEPVLQECLLGNRRLVKIKSLMRKLQKLQEKAVAEEDYEKAEKFRRRLEELHKEKSLLNFQLPSQHPSVSSFLEKFRVYCQMTLYDGYTVYSISAQKEIEVVRAKLAVLEAKDQQLRIEIQEQDHHVQEQDYELSALLSWVSLKELQTTGKALADILASVGAECSRTGCDGSLPVLPCYTPPAQPALVTGCPPGKIQGFGVNVQSPARHGSGILTGASPAGIECQPPCTSTQARAPRGAVCKPVSFGGALGEGLFCGGSCLMEPITPGLCLAPDLHLPYDLKTWLFEQARLC
uniref:DISC1 scaffold protein n=1 Tax=Naja naja TaxID=35670 RepID=A0A8C6VMV8_NAJNA